MPETLIYKHKEKGENREMTQMREIKDERKKICTMRNGESNDQKREKGKRRDKQTKRVNRLKIEN